MANATFISASEIVTQVCRDLNYSRSHVAKVLRKKAKHIGAKRRGGKWVMTKDGEVRLRQCVEVMSGRRYKLGEKGPNGAAWLP